MATTAKIKQNGVFVPVGGTDEGADTYSRPTDWLPLPALSTQKVVGLVAIFNQADNSVAFTCSGNYTVDWGDGSAAENVSAGTKAVHNITWASINTSTLTSRGYRQAIVTITPQAGQNLTSIDLAKNATGTFGASHWLDIGINAPSCTTLAIGSQSNQGVPVLLERVEYTGTSSITTGAVGVFGRCHNLRSVVGTAWTSSITNFSYFFTGCATLQSVPLLDTANGTLFTSMFDGCYGLRSVPLLNTAKATDMSLMFQSCYALRSVPLFNTGLVQNMNTTFSACRSLRSVPLFNLASATILNNMFNDCRSLVTVPLFNTTACIQSGGMFTDCYALLAIPLFVMPNNIFVSGMFDNCKSLQVGAISGQKNTIVYTNCNLSATELDSIYTNLASGVTGKTITVTGNPGIASDTPSIATAKGWTVTGS